tara:strand:- start:1149 stop:1310 length:162 start_codon:yes stop_codon:yes gene_type:complete
MDLELTRGESPFSDIILKRLEKQEQQFLKPKFNNYALLSFIPLAIVGYFILKK